MKPSSYRDDVLSDAERADLFAALDDEYMARATYAQVIADFGDVRPFSNIVESEGRHIEALVSLFERYGVPVPSDTWPGRVPRFASLHEACLAGVAAEVENGELYERLLSGTVRDDILAVYRNLQEASQERHLPAFRRCAVYRNLQEASQERHLPAFRRCVERGGESPGDGRGSLGGGRQRRRRGR